MLAYLMLTDGHRATRERLAGLFWPDRGEAQSRASLRQCLVELRALLGEGLRAEREWIAVDHRAMTSDWSELHTALTGDATAFASALASIAGEPLLDGMEFGEAFDDWLRACRATTEARLAAGVLRHINQCNAAGDWSAALAVADAWNCRDPCDEAVVGAAIATEMARDAPAAARRRFRTLEAALSRQGDGPPGSAVRAALEGAPAADSGPCVSTPVDFATGGDLVLPARPSIAVMPFTDINAGAEFSDGMVEEIGTALSRFTGLFVIAGRSSLSYRDSGKPTHHIARELGVRYLLEGSVRRADGRIRITVKLLDAVIGEQIWADRFDDVLADVFDLQDRVASAVACQIDATLVDAEMRRAVHRPTNSPDSYELCLVANALLTRYERAAVVDALDHAERAVALDPDYGWAVATAGFCHATLLLNGWADRPEETLAAADRYAERAMRCAGNDLMALTVTAGLLASRRSKLDAASQFIERAMALNPQKAFVLFWAGVIDCESGRFERGLDRLEQTARLDPRSVYRPWILTWMGGCLVGLGRHEEAVVVLGEACRLLPAFPVPAIMFAVSLGLSGREQEAKRQFVLLDGMGGVAHCRQYLRCEALRDAFDNALAVIAPAPEVA